MPLKIDFDASHVAAKARVSLETAAREVLQDLALDVIRRTPVDTGFLRGNWTVNLNAPPSGRASDGGQPEVAYPGSNKFPPIAPQTAARVSAGIGKLRAGDTLYLTNNARYAAIIENGNATRRPRAMVRSAIANLDNIAQETITRIRRTMGMR